MSHVRKEKERVWVWWVLCPEASCREPFGAGLDEGDYRRRVRPTSPLRLALISGVGVSSGTSMIAVAVRRVGLRGRERRQYGRELQESFAGPRAVRRRQRKGRMETRLTHWMPSWLVLR